MGTLYIVSTPIGNLEDITIRAVKTLFSVDGIACEDTRKTGILMQELQKRYPSIINSIENRQYQRLISYYEENEDKRIPEIITALKNNLEIALVSDAGTPLISDPGFRLVRECIKEGIKIISVPGASSILAALTSSGLPTDKFLFVGYPPRKEGNRIKFFNNIKKSQESLVSTIIIFESPHRLLKTLQELHSIFTDIPIVIARELTKIHEEVRFERISEAIVHFSTHSPKGEFVLLMNTALA